MSKVKSLADIGRLANVSAATVSRALRNSPEIGAETKEKIRELARKHNYTLNATASNLRLQKTNTVAVILNASDEVSGELSEQTYIANILGGLCDELSHQGLDMIVSSKRTVSQCWDQYFLQSKRADGIIVLGQGQDPAVFTRLANLGTPFVVYGAYTQQRAYCVIGCDSYKSGNIATSHLITDANRKRILYLGPTQSFEGKQRLEGYCKAHHELGMAVVEDRVIDCLLCTDSAYQCLDATLQKGKPEFDGIFAFSDTIAIGALQCLSSHGVRVPEDVAVIGFDDIHAASYVTPALTTINQQQEKVAELLVSSLQKLIVDGKTNSIKIPSELVIRASSVTC